MGPSPTVRLERHEILPVCAFLLLVIGCGRSAAGSDQPTFVLSTSPADEILFLRLGGGNGALVPWYHLYGDGRLVREIVHQSQTAAPFQSETTHLSLTDVDLLFQLIAGSRVPSATQERLVEQVGQPLPRALDASGIILDLNFASYTPSGGDTLAPFTPRVYLQAPGYLAELFPQIPEIQGVMAVLETLDSYFPRSADQVILGDLYRPKEEE